MPITQEEIRARVALWGDEERQSPGWTSFVEEKFIPTVREVLESGADVEKAFLNALSDVWPIVDRMYNATKLMGHSRQDWEGTWLAMREFPASITEPIKTIFKGEVLDPIVFGGLHEIPRADFLAGILSNHPTAKRNALAPQADNLLTHIINDFGVAERAIAGLVGDLDHTLQLLRDGELETVEANRSEFLRGQINALNEQGNACQAEDLDARREELDALEEEIARFQGIKKQSLLEDFAHVEAFYDRIIETRATLVDMYEKLGDWQAREGAYKAFTEEQRETISAVVTQAEVVSAAINELGVVGKPPVPQANGPKTAQSGVETTPASRIQDSAAVLTVSLKNIVGNAHNYNAIIAERDQIQPDSHVARQEQRGAAEQGRAGGR